MEIVKIFVLEHEFLRMEEWLHLLPDLPIGSKRYSIRDFTWVGYRNIWYAQVSISFVEEEDVLVFKLKFQTTEDVK